MSADEMRDGRAPHIRRVAGRPLLENLSSRKGQFSIRSLSNLKPMRNREKGCFTCNI
jgi:hypothetical protein